MQTYTLCSLNIPYNSLYNASYYMCRKITSHWQPLFSKKMVAAASFSYKIGGGGLIFQQNWRRWQPVCSTWHKFPNPGAAISTKNVLFPKFYKVHFRASILVRLPYQKCLKKLGWRVISKKNLLVILTGASCFFQKICKI